MSVIGEYSIVWPAGLEDPTIRTLLEQLGAELLEAGWRAPSGASQHAGHAALLQGTKKRDSPRASREFLARKSKQKTWKDRSAKGQAK